MVTVLLKGFPVWELNGSPLYNEIRRVVKARFGDSNDKTFKMYLKPKSKVLSSSALKGLTYLTHTHRNR